MDAYKWSNKVGAGRTDNKRPLLHDAKPSECLKGDRDNKSEVYFKNILFLQTGAAIKKSRLFFYI